MAEGVYKITDQFEEALARYTGAPFAIAVDNCSNALFLALTYQLRFSDRDQGREITIPARTYPSVPCAIIQAGGRVKFAPVEGTTLKGAYPLLGTTVWDSALRFTSQMYRPGTFMCLSFTGPFKHLKLGKGGAILTDNLEACLWFRRVRFSGRRECSYHEDAFDMLGWNFYMLPEIAARGLQLMAQFYNLDGTSKDNPDIELPYPDLSKFSIYTQEQRS